MKENLGRYIFIITVSVLIISSLIVFYKNNKEEDKNKLTEEIEYKYSNILNLSIYNLDTINPLVSKNKDVKKISKLIFDPLIDLDENYRIKYSIAKECVQISDKSYLIRIDEDVKWQDGINITSKDIEFTVNQIKKIDSIYSKQVEFIENIERIDDQTIKVNLKDKIDFFEYYLDFPILPSHIYENKEVVDKDIIPIGTGRFKIKKIDSEAIILEKNEFLNRNNEENSKIEEIHIYLYNNIDEILNNFKVGNIDLLDVSNINYQNYIEKNFYNIKEYKGREFDFISFNCKDSLLSIKEIRNAIKLAIDKVEINLNKNKYYIANFPLDYDNFLYKEEYVNEYIDKEKSKKILQDLGWSYQNNKWQKRNKNGNIINLSFELIVQEYNWQRIKIAEEIKKQLENIGIDLKIKKVSEKQYSNILETYNYQIILTGVNSGLNPNLEYFYGKQNVAQFENEELKAIIEEVPKIKDENLLKEKIRKIIEIQNEESPYIALYRNKEAILLNKNINGEINPNMHNIFYGIWTWNKKI